MDNEKTTLNKITKIIDAEHKATGKNAFIICGDSDSEELEMSSVSEATGDYSCIIGGCESKATGFATANLNAYKCVNEGKNSVCIGGGSNCISGDVSFAIGGEFNTIEGDWSLILNSKECNIKYTHGQGDSVIVGSYGSTIDTQHAIIINSNLTEIRHVNTTAIGGEAHPAFDTLNQTESIVSIMGCGNETDKKSGLAVLKEGGKDNAKTYIKNVGGWDGTEESIPQAQDVATLLSAQSDKIKELEEQISALSDKIKELEEQPSESTPTTDSDVEDEESEEEASKE